MEYIRLIGILIVIVGFALKLDSILIIFLAAVTTALAGGLGIVFMRAMRDAKNSDPHAGH